MNRTYIKHGEHCEGSARWTGGIQYSWRVVDREDGMSFKKCETCGETSEPIPKIDHDKEMADIAETSITETIIE